MNKSYVWLTAPLILSLLGCSLGPQYIPPMNDAPCEWHSRPSEGMSNQSTECFVWWEALNDPLLNSLIKRAFLQNLDLDIAATRVIEARSERTGKQAEGYPRVDASASAGRVHFGKNGIVNRVLKDSCSDHNTKRTFNFFEIGFDAEWEIDLFGRIAHETRALDAKIDSIEESLCDIWISLSAEIAKNYIELRGSQLQLEITEKNIASQQDTIQLVQKRLDIGVASIIELRQAEEQFYTLSAQKPLLELSIQKSIHRLSILLGYAPDELFAELSQPASLPQIPYHKPIGLPSELLRRRPDIRKAERELASETEQIGSAVAALFPRLSLRGFLGDISTQLSSLSRSSSGTYLAGPQLLLPIFNSRLLMQDVKNSKVRTRRAYYEYQKAVLEALEETENSLATFHYELEKQQHLAESQTSIQEAYRLTSQLYERGLKDYLEVQLLNRSLLSAENASIQSQIDLLLHYISLYKALGGGWNVIDCEEEALP